MSNQCCFKRSLPERKLQKSVGSDFFDSLG